tara:strand:- start:299 stop:499 length:201 start_codon:yes stop_codon:yes gene_type:complete
MCHDSDITKEDLIQSMEDLIQQLKKPNAECPSFSWDEGNEYELDSGHLCMDYDIQIKIAKPNNPGL